MKERINLLYGEHQKGQAQFAYFQLGLSASAIAFAIHETSNKALENTPWPIAAGVALWAASFFFGCLGLQARLQGLLTNTQYLIALEKTAPELRDHPDLKEALTEAEALVASDVNRAAPRFRWQLWSLYVGALFYIAGHVMVMAALSAKC